MIKSEYQILSRKIEETKTQVKSVQNGIDTLQSDLTVDRQDIDELKRRQGEIDATLKSIVDKLNRIEKDQKSVIREVVAESIEKETQALRDTLDSFIKSKSKVLLVREKFNIFTKMFRFFRGQKNELIKEIQKEVNE